MSPGASVLAWRAFNSKPPIKSPQEAPVGAWKVNNKEGSASHKGLC